MINDDFADAVEHLNDLEKNLESLNQNDLALYYFCQGRILQRVKLQMDEAIAAYEKSYELFCSLQYSEERLRTSNYLTTLLINQDQLSKAFSYLNEAYDDSIAFKASGVEKISLLNNLGLAHAKKENFILRSAFETGTGYQQQNIHLLSNRCYIHGAWLVL
ncbi:hypothetical protein MGI18_24340 [Bacillus sp. OVS6]|nr:hypothetical protein MGI18_24340 [Bacillus sp. OVS6]